MSRCSWLCFEARIPPQKNACFQFKPKETNKSHIKICPATFLSELANQRGRLCLSLTLYVLRERRKSSYLREPIPPFIWSKWMLHPVLRDTPSLPFLDVPVFLRLRVADIAMPRPSWQTRNSTPKPRWWWADTHKRNIFQSERLVILWCFTFFAVSTAYD